MAAPEQSGNMLTHKLGPLPIWAWAGIALVAVYLYRRYSSGAAAASTTATTGAAPLAVPTETLNTSGGTYTGPVGGAPPAITSPGNPAGATVSPGNTGVAAFVPPTNETLAAGGGYYVPGSTATIQGYGGNSYAPIQSSQQYETVIAGGGQAYAQPQPGQFTPLPVSAGIPSNLPIYSQLPSA